MLLGQANCDLVASPGGDREDAVQFLKEKATGALTVEERRAAVAAKDCGQAALEADGQLIRDTRDELVGGDDDELAVIEPTSQQATPHATAVSPAFSAGAEVTRQLQRTDAAGRQAPAREVKLINGQVADFGTSRVRALVKDQTSGQQSAPERGGDSWENDCNSTTPVGAPQADGCSTWRLPHEHGAGMNNRLDSVEMERNSLTPSHTETTTKQQQQQHQHRPQVAGDEIAETSVLASTEEDVRSVATESFVAPVEGDGQNPGPLAGLNVDDTASVDTSSVADGSRAKADSLSEASSMRPTATETSAVASLERAVRVEDGLLHEATDDPHFVDSDRNSTLKPGDAIEGDADIGKANSNSNFVETSPPEHVRSGVIADYLSNTLSKLVTAELNTTAANFAFKLGEAPEGYAKSVKVYSNMAAQTSPSEDVRSVVVAGYLSNTLSKLAAAELNTTTVDLTQVAPGDRTLKGNLAASISAKKLSAWTDVHQLEDNSTCNETFDHLNVPLDYGSVASAQIDDEYTESAFADSSLFLSVEARVVTGYLEGTLDKLLAEESTMARQTPRAKIAAVKDVPLQSLPVPMVEQTRVEQAEEAPTKMQTKEYLQPSPSKQNSPPSDIKVAEVVRGDSIGDDEDHQAELTLPTSVEARVGADYLKRTLQDVVEESFHSQPSASESFDEDSNVPRSSVQEGTSVSTSHKDPRQASSSSACVGACAIADYLEGTISALAKAQLTLTAPTPTQRAFESSERGSPKSIDERSAVSLSTEHVSSEAAPLADAGLPETARNGCDAAMEPEEMAVDNTRDTSASASISSISLEDRVVHDYLDNTYEGSVAAFDNRLQTSNLLQQSFNSGIMQTAERAGGGSGDQNNSLSSSKKGQLHICTQTATSHADPLDAPTPSFQAPRIETGGDRSHPELPIGFDDSTVDKTGANNYVDSAQREIKGQAGRDNDSLRFSSADIREKVIVDYLSDLFAGIVNGEPLSRDRFCTCGAKSKAGSIEAEASREHFPLDGASLACAMASMLASGECTGECPPSIDTTHGLAALLSAPSGSTKMTDHREDGRSISAPKFSDDSQITPAISHGSTLDIADSDNSSSQNAPEPTNETNVVKSRLSMEEVSRLQQSSDRQVVPDDVSGTVRSEAITFLMAEARGALDREKDEPRGEGISSASPRPSLEVAMLWLQDAGRRARADQDRAMKARSHAAVDLKARGKAALERRVVVTDGGKKFKGNEEMVNAPSRRGSQLKNPDGVMHDIRGALENGVATERDNTQVNDLVEQHRLPGSEEPHAPVEKTSWLPMTRERRRTAEEKLIKSRANIVAELMARGTAALVELGCMIQDEPALQVIDNTGKPADSVEPLPLMRDLSGRATIPRNSSVDARLGAGAVVLAKGKMELEKDEMPSEEDILTAMPPAPLDALTWLQAAGKRAVGAQECVMKARAEAAAELAIRGKASLEGQILEIKEILVSDVVQRESLFNPSPSYVMPPQGEGEQATVMRNSVANACSEAGTEVLAGGRAACKIEQVEAEDFRKQFTPNVAGTPHPAVDAFRWLQNIGEKARAAQNEVAQTRTSTVLDIATKGKVSLEKTHMVAETTFRMQHVESDQDPRSSPSALRWLHEAGARARGAQAKRVTDRSVVALNLAETGRAAVKHQEVMGEGNLTVVSSRTTETNVVSPRVADQVPTWGGRASVLKAFAGESRLEGAADCVKRGRAEFDDESVDEDDGLPTQSNASVVRHGVSTEVSLWLQAKGGRAMAAQQRLAEARAEAVATLTAKGVASLEREKMMEEDRSTLRGQTAHHCTPKLVAGVSSTSLQSASGSRDYAAGRTKPTGNTHIDTECVDLRKHPDFVEAVSERMRGHQHVRGSESMKSTLSKPTATPSGTPREIDVDDTVLSEIRRLHTQSASFPETVQHSSDEQERTTPPCGKTALDLSFKAPAELTSVGLTESEFAGKVEREPVASEPSEGQGNAASESQEASAALKIVSCDQAHQARVSQEEPEAARSRLDIRAGVDARKAAEVSQEPHAITKMTRALLPRQIVTSSEAGQDDRQRLTTQASADGGRLTTELPPAERTAPMAWLAPATDKPRDGDWGDGSNASTAKGEGAKQFGQVLDLNDGEWARVSLSHTPPFDALNSSSRAFHSGGGPGVAAQRQTPQTENTAVQPSTNVGFCCNGAWDNINAPAAEKPHGIETAEMMAEAERRIVLGASTKSGQDFGSGWLEFFAPVHRLAPAGDAYAGDEALRSAAASASSTTVGANSQRSFLSYPSGGSAEESGRDGRECIADMRRICSNCSNDHEDGYSRCSHSMREVQNPAREAQRRMIRNGTYSPSSGGRGWDGQGFEVDDHSSARYRKAERRRREGEGRQRWNLAAERSRQYIRRWEAFLVHVERHFHSEAQVRKRLSLIRRAHPDVNNEVAFVALAQSRGRASEAAAVLHLPSAKDEALVVTMMLDVRSFIALACETIERRRRRLLKEKARRRQHEHLRQSDPHTDGTGSSNGDDVIMGIMGPSSTSQRHPEQPDKHRYRRGQHEQQIKKHPQLVQHRQNKFVHQGDGREISSCGWETDEVDGDVDGGGSNAAHCFRRVSSEGHRFSDSFPYRNEGHEARQSTDGVSRSLSCRERRGKHGGCERAPTAGGHDGDSCVSVTCDDHLRDSSTGIRVGEMNGCIVMGRGDSKSSNQGDDAPFTDRQSAKIDSRKLYLPPRRASESPSAPPAVLPPLIGLVSAGGTPPTPNTLKTVLSTSTSVAVAIPAGFGLKEEKNDREHGRIGNDRAGGKQAPDSSVNGKWSDTNTTREQSAALRRRARRHQQRRMAEISAPGGGRSPSGLDGMTERALRETRTLDRDHAYLGALLRGLKGRAGGRRGGDNNGCARGTTLTPYGSSVPDGFSLDTTSFGTVRSSRRKNESEMSQESNSINRRYAFQGYFTQALGDMPRAVVSAGRGAEKLAGFAEWEEEGHLLVAR